MPRPPSIMKNRATPGRDVRTPVPIPSTYSVAPNALAELLGLDVPASRVSVSEGTVTGLPAIQYGVDMIAHAVAAMMTDATVYDEAGDEIDTPNIVSRPSTLLGAYEFWTQTVDCLMKRGNYPAILADYDPDGYPQQVVPVHPDACSMDDTAGIPLYTIGAATWRWDEVVHVRHGAPVGQLWGCGVVERYRQSLSTQLTEAEYGRTSFSSGGVPSAHVTLDKMTVTDEEAEAVDARWQSKFGDGARKPVITGKAMSITPLSWSPHDAEFIESRRLSIAEAALICGLDPADLGATVGGSGLTYANLTDRQLSRILQSFMPWMRLLEEAWSDLLPGRQYVRGNVEALLRSSTAERFDVYEVGHRLGVFTTAELRDMEKRPVLPSAETPPQPPTEGGDDDE